MTRDELLTLLRSMDADQPDGAGDPESNHRRADEALLKYINDPEVTKAFNRIEMWYA